MRLREKVIVAAASLLFAVTLSAYAGGTPETPELPATTTGTQYLSPNGDGVQDEATVKFSVTIYVKSESGYVPKYGLEILPPDGGEPVERIVKQEKRDIGWFSALFQGYKKFTLERSVTWDGTDMEGNMVSDGRYSLRIWVEDPSGKRQEKEVEDFIVDTVPPEAVIVEPEYLVFSPNGDGVRDTITISHEKATEEQLWTGEFRNAEGEAVRTFRWENGTPGTAEWDGRADDGSKAPAGMYDYVLSSTDRAGNESGEIRLEGIELVREETPVEVIITPQSFSPNEDGVQDTATAHLDQAEKEGIVGWSWRVTDSQGKTIEQHSFETQEVPETVPLDGTTKEGVPYRPGTYTFSYTVEYRFGNQPSGTQEFTVDIQPPMPELEVNHPLFSPNGDGNKDTVSIRADVDERVSWEGRILDRRGREVISGECETGKDSFLWDGRSAAGDTVESGVYTVEAEFTDAAGNTAQAEPLKIALDIKPISLSISAPESFTIQAGEMKGELPVRVKSNKHNQVERWSMTIRPVDGTGRRSYSGWLLLPKEVRWDGTLKTGADELRKAPAGEYYAEIEVRYRRGDLLKAESDPFRIRRSSSQ